MFYGNSNAIRILEILPSFSNHINILKEYLNICMRFYSYCSTDKQFSIKLKNCFLLGFTTRL